MAAWPNYGRLELPGYSEEPGSAVQRTVMESGPAKQLQVLSLQDIPRSVTYLYSAPEYGTWLTFYRTTINRGTDWFDWVDPRDGVTRQARIVEGKYKAEPYAEAPGAPLSWRVSCRLETLE